MTEMVRSRKERIRAPRGNDLAMIVPDRKTLSELVRANHDYWSSSAIPSWIKELRTHSRQQLRSVALNYVDSYLAGKMLPSPELFEGRPWIVGGHQPELFHAGVWFKNILIDRIAKETQSVGLHAIIDHDLARATTLRVPVRESGRALTHTSMIPLPLKRPASTDALLPWNAWCLDPEKIPGTVADIEQSLRSVGIARSMASDYLDELRGFSQETNAAIALSQVRHRMERRNGIGNWEFPMSDMCRSQAWWRFVDHCIANAFELNQTYNECLDEYRSREGIRNPTQPVPRLGQQGDWIELPFWIQLPGQVARRRMWIKKGPSTYRISSEPNSQAPTTEWSERLQNDDWLVWPRALTTTLFLRVFIADLFVHGIGGGQYDLLTDAIIKRFLHLEPPKFVTCTATLWLPFPGSSKDDEQRLQEQALALERDRQRLRSAPETVLELKDPSQKILAEKHQRLLSQIPPRGQKKNWHHEMVELKAKIVASIDQPRREWEERRAELEAKILENKVLKSREFSYVLFEERDIFERLLKLANC